MVVNLIVNWVALFVGFVIASLVGTYIAQELRVSRWTQLLFECAGVAIVCTVAIMFWFLEPLGGGVAVLAMFLMGAFGIWRNGNKHEKALNGEYGDEVQWASELIEEGDDLFIIAMNTISRTDMKEVGIIAESKEELRELTVERFEEQEGGEQVPDDFC